MKNDARVRLSRPTNVLACKQLRLNDSPGVLVDWFHKLNRKLALERGPVDGVLRSIASEHAGKFMLVFFFTLKNPDLPGKCKCAVSANS